MGPKKITIMGWYGSHNAGDEAILSAIVTNIKHKIPLSNITVISNDPALTIRIHNTKSIYIKDKLSILQALFNTDLFILGGGGLLKPNSALRHLKYLLLFKIFGSKTISYALGAIPLNNGFEKAVTRLALNLSDVITVRDYQSKEVLESLGVKRNIQVTADAAFGINIENDIENENEFNEELKIIGRPYAAICLKEWQHEDLHEVRRYVNFDQFIESLARLCRLLIKEKELDLVFLPFQVSKNENDIPIHKLLMAKCGYKDSLHLIEKRLTHREIIPILRNAELTIGMRLHSLIFSAIANTPIAALSYSPKVADFMKNIGLEHYCIDLRNFNEEKLLEIVNLAHRKRKTLSQILIKVVKSQRLKALQNVKLALAILEDG